MKHLVPNFEEFLNESADKKWYLIRSDSNGTTWFTGKGDEFSANPADALSFKNIKDASKKSKEIGKSMVHVMTDDEMQNEIQKTKK